MTMASSSLGSMKARTVSRRRRKSVACEKEGGDASESTHKSRTAELAAPAIFAFAMPSDCERHASARRKSGRIAGLRLRFQSASISFSQLQSAARHRADLDVDVLARGNLLHRRAHLGDGHAT